MATKLLSPWQVSDGRRKEERDWSISDSERDTLISSPMSEIDFRDRAFCFTGKLADLKRSQAEREARARGGLTTEVVNERLDFLVVGSIPSPAWKHGSYGTKIEAARKLQVAAHRLKIVSEGDFVEALALVPTADAGAIDSQVFVASYGFIAPDLSSFDRTGVEQILTHLATAQSFLVRARVHELWFTKDLFDQFRGRTSATHGIAIELRLVKQLPIAVDVGAIVAEIEKSFERLQGVDGKLRWFTKVEGSADYIRLVRELPSNLRLE